MKKYNLILFDLDGTLTDPGEGISNSVAYALNKFGISVADKRELYKFIGPPLHESFEKFYGFSEAKAKLAVEYYREYYKDKGIFENFLYDGVEELLLALKESGKRIVLATSKPELFAKRILDHFGLSSYFHFVAGANLDGTRTDKAEVIAYALENCGRDEPSGVLMVGDREHDIIGAKANGIDSVGVLFGYGSKEELERAGADHIVGNIQEILKLILEEQTNSAKSEI